MTPSEEVTIRNLAGAKPGEATVDAVRRMDLRRGELEQAAGGQATNCAVCGEHRYTPLRRDDMGGYVCLTCIDKQLNWSREDRESLTKETATLRAEIQILAEQRDALRVELAESEEWGCQYRDEVAALRARVKDLESQGRLSRFVGDVLGAAWRAAR